MGGHAFSARRAFDLAHLRHGWTGCGKTRLRDKSLPQRLKSRHWFGTAFAALKGRSSTVLHACASFSAVC